VSYFRLIKPGES